MIPIDEYDNISKQGESIQSINEVSDEQNGFEQEHTLTYRNKVYKMDDITTENTTNKKNTTKESNLATINRIIGDKNTFVKTSLLNGSNKLIKMSNTEKKRFLMETFGLNYFEESYNIYDNNVDELNIHLVHIEEQIFDITKQIINKKKTKMNDNNGMTELIRITPNTYQQKIDESTILLNEIRQQMEVCNDDTYLITDIITAISNINMLRIFNDEQTDISPYELINKFLFHKLHDIENKKKYIEKMLLEYDELDIKYDKEIDEKMLAITNTLQKLCTMKCNTLACNNNNVQGIMMEILQKQCEINNMCMQQKNEDIEIEYTKQSTVLKQQKEELIKEIERHTNRKRKIIIIHN